jgi:NADH-quinone oxidoreductase subunit N
LATIGIFAVLVKMDDYTIDGFNGLSKKQPLMAVMAAIFLLSLTGIPLTAGFTAKFYMLMAAAQTGHYTWLIIFAVICAAISAYYYFRVIQAMFFKEPAENGQKTWDINMGFKILLIITALLIIILGLFPNIITEALHY